MDDIKGFRRTTYEIIENVIVEELDRVEDERGWLLELCRNDYLTRNAQPLPAMAYLSMTMPNIVRGPHEHLDQTDHFFFVDGQITIYLWDNRKWSATFEQYIEIYAGFTRPIGLIVPPRVVHAYKNTGKDVALVINAPDKLYKGTYKQEDVDEIRHENDPNSPFKVRN